MHHVGEMFFLGGGGILSVEMRLCSLGQDRLFFLLVVVCGGCLRTSQCGVVFLTVVVRNGLSISYTQISTFYKNKVRGVVFLTVVVRNGLSISYTQISTFYKNKVRNCVLLKENAPCYKKDPSQIHRCG